LLLPLRLDVRISDLLLGLFASLYGFTYFLVDREIPIVGKIIEQDLDLFKNRIIVGVHDYMNDVQFQSCFHHACWFQSRLQKSSQK